jgi:hypothetical protein
MCIMRESFQHFVVLRICPGTKVTGNYQWYGKLSVHKTNRNTTIQCAYWLQSWKKQKGEICCRYKMCSDLTPYSRRRLLFCINEALPVFPSPSPHSSGSHLFICSGPVNLHACGKKKSSKKLVKEESKWQYETHLTALTYIDSELWAFHYFFNCKNLEKEAWTVSVKCKFRYWSWSWKLLKLSSHIVGNVGRLFQCRLSCFFPQKPNPHMSNFCKIRNIWWSITTRLKAST